MTKIVKGWTQVAFTAFILMVGISIMLNEAGILNSILKMLWQNIFSGLSLVSVLLFAIAAVLAWNCFKKTGTILYKWLAVALILKVGLWLESLLFCQIDFMPSTASNSSVLAAVHLQLAFNMVHTMLLQFPGAIIAAMLFVFAISRCGKNVRFFEVFKLKYVLLLCTVFVLGTVVNIIAAFQLWGQLNLLNFAGGIIIDSLAPVIYLYGIRVARQRLPACDNSLLNWLIIFLILEVMSWLIVLIFNLITLLWPLHRLVMFFNYPSHIINIAMPLILIIGLFMCSDEKRC